MSTLSHRFQSAAPHVFVGLWLTAVGLSLAFGATAEAPPVGGDGISYVVKAAGFWDAVRQGQLFNPFNIAPTFRPPGTILMSYPLGYPTDSHWFLFRSVYLPVLLLVAAVYIAAWAKPHTHVHGWTIAAICLALGGMPILYQFQWNETLPSFTTWGMVDNFMSGVAALAMAATLRATQTRSLAWAIAGALLAAFCLSIKPAGSLVMALVAAAWLLLEGSRLNWSLAALTGDRANGRFVAFGTAAGAAIYALTALAAFASDYLAGANITYGRQSMVILKNDDIRSFFAAYTDDAMRLSFGYVVPSLVGLGLVAGFCIGGMAVHAAMALLALATAVWFLFVVADITQIRYVIVFGVIALFALIPPLVRGAARLAVRWRTAAVAVAIFPALMTAILLTAPGRFTAVQGVLGVNLITNHYESEVRQATSFLTRLKETGIKSSTVFLLDFSHPMLAFTDTIQFRTFVDPTLPRVNLPITVDWIRPSTMRVEELLASDYIAFTPLIDTDARSKILAERVVPNFNAELMLVAAWLSTLTPEDGVVTISETGVTLLQISNRSKLDAAVTRLERDHEMPAAYYAANPQRWWSSGEIAARSPPLAAVSGVEFQSARAETESPNVRLNVATARAITVDGELVAEFWIDQSSAEAELPGRWYLFAHVVDSAGEILVNRQVQYLNSAPPSPARSLRHYRIPLGARPAKATAIAFGLFREQNNQVAEVLRAAGDEVAVGEPRAVMRLPTVAGAPLPAE